MGASSSGSGGELDSSADLIGVLGVVGLAGLFTIVPHLPPVWLEAAVGLTLTLFVPGYVLVAILFPSRETAAGCDHENSDRTGLDLVERVVLSFGASVAVLIIVGVALGVTPWGLHRETMFVSLATLVLLGTPIAAVRRSRLAPAHGLSPRALGRLPSRLVAERRLETGMNLALAALVVMALPAFGLVIGPTGEEGVTEMYLLAHTGEGEFVAGEYPDSLGPDEEQGLAIGVSNYEEDPRTYTVVVQLQRAETDEVVAELHRFTFELHPGEEERIEHFVRPGEETTGEDIRLVYLLFTDGVPVLPTIESADQHLHLLVDIEEESTDGEAASLGADRGGRG